MAGDEPRWVHAVVDQEHRYSLSTEVATGRQQLQVQIAAGPVDYEVTEDLDDANFVHLLADPEAAPSLPVVHPTVVRHVPIMAARKLSITLHPDIAAAISASATQHGESVSAWIDRTSRDALRREEGLSAVDEWEREHGAFTLEELARADAEVEAMVEAGGRSAGAACPLAGTADVVDASVAVGALVREDVVVTSDPKDIERLARAIGQPVAMRSI